MKKHFPYLRWKYILLHAPIFLLLIASTAITGVNAQLPQLFVDPTPATIEAVGENVTIAVNVTYVENLYGWDFRLTYNDTLLEKVSITVVGPGQVAPSQPANYTLTDVSVPGTIIFGCAFFEAQGALPFDGSGVLAWITFEGKMIGVSDLDFVEGVTFLWDPNGMMISRDLCVGGEIEVIPEFPAAILLPLLLILTLIAVFLGKKFSQRSARMPSALSR